jgi:hypothetical protein
MDTADRTETEIVSLAEGGYLCSIEPNFDQARCAVNAQMSLKLMPHILGDTCSTGCGARRHIVSVSKFPCACYENPADSAIRARPETLQVSRRAALAKHFEPQVVVEIALRSWE